MATLFGVPSMSFLSSSLLPFLIAPGSYTEATEGEGTRTGVQMGEGGGGRRSRTQGAIRAEWRNQVSFLEGDSEPGLGVGGETQFGRGKWGNDLMMAPRW